MILGTLLFFIVGGFIQPIEKGNAGPGLLAKIATDKFWLHLLCIDRSRCLQP
jgi:hypothetical protein